jgi:hypothetical protein
MNNIEKRIHYELKEEQYNVRYKDDFMVVDLYKESNCFTFKLKVYPFKPPFAFYKNGKKINYNVETIPHKLLQNYMQTYNECPCCVSLLCPVQWNPGNKLHDLIKEYNEVSEKIIVCQKKRFFKQIQNLPYEMVDQILSFCT